MNEVRVMNGSPDDAGALVSKRDTRMNGFDGTG